MRIEFRKGIGPSRVLPNEIRKGDGVTFAYFFLVTDVHIPKLEQHLQRVTHVTELNLQGKNSTHHSADFFRKQVDCSPRLSIFVSDKKIEHREQSI